MIVTERVFRWWDYACFLALTALNLAALAWFLAAWCVQPDWREHAVLLGLVSLLLAYHVALQQFRWFLLPIMRRPTPMPPQAGWQVGVATTFVPEAESLEMLEEVVKALIAMAYPHDTWVLDEGDDARLGARHFSRKHCAHYHAATGRFRSRSKHGNYNAWLDAVGWGCSRSCWRAAWCPSS
jgi:hypothetical protein